MMENDQSVLSRRRWVVMGPFRLLFLRLCYWFGCEECETQW